MTILPLLLAATMAASAADCTTPWFPTSADATLRYRQQVWLLIDEEQSAEPIAEIEMLQERFAAAKGTLTFQQTFKGTRETTAYRCVEDGLVPADATSAYAKTTFGGVQYGTNLGDGKQWTFTWKSVGDGWTLTAKWDYRVIGREKIEVPAGTFDATRIDYRGTSTSSQRGELPPTEGTIWIAEGIGLIKQVDIDRGQALVPQKTTLELIARK